jgi:uncharacterized protein YgfB (UPF0149 family)
MPRIILPLADWRAVVHELEGNHTAPAPPGLAERVREMLVNAPQAWPDQDFALELDEGSAEAVRAVHAALTGEVRHQGHGAASVTEAMRIIQDHQRRG